MTRVAPVKLLYNPHTLWFDPQDLNPAKDQHVVVSTARGIEFGTMADNVLEVSEEDVAALPVELKPVIRIATPEDEELVEINQKKSIDALPIFKELAAESDLDMHPISVEYLHEGDKAVFHFEADDRVDFRELVRKLAGRLHIHVDMHQIGARDEARLIGGIGHCGQELCCKRLSGEFLPVSVRMAKEQDLSLNPQKNSGLCGRLMCCLRYEFDAYKEFHERAPKVGAVIKTPEGPAKVVELNVPREIVSIKLEEEEKPKRVPLAYFVKPKEGERPSVIDKKQWDKLLEEQEMRMVGIGIYSTSQFTGEDILASTGSVRRNATSGSFSAVSTSSRKSSTSDLFSSPASEGQKDEDSSKRKRRERQKDKPAHPEKRRSGRGKEDYAEGLPIQAPLHNGVRRRASVVINASSDDSPLPAVPIEIKKGSQEDIPKREQGIRPGHRSSGVRRFTASDADTQVKPIQGTADYSAAVEPTDALRSSSASRRPRRRSQNSKESKGNHGE
ncbi:MAG: hypothetical protein J6Y65_00135 [Eggerthellaceae bacterium]|nr:hypothetical protein [Eggerthellaceae bacterium]